jgi:hypothetical protein
MRFNQAGEIIEIHQADGDIRAIRLISGLTGETTSGKVDSPVTGTKSAKETANLGRTDIGEFPDRK